MADIFKTKTAGACWDIQTEKRFRRRKALEPYGFKVYSQNDEDGIISEIFKRIGTTDKRFIEFGVENGLECNSHYLLLKGWSGLWLEGSKEQVRQIKNRFRPVLQSGQLQCCQAFITRENVNQLFLEHGFSGQIDLLSIDVDGNDYHIWKAVTAVSPRVVVIEYNAKFPPECEWGMPYHAGHIWDGSDRQGASLKSLEKLGREKGYQLAGTNINGINAFFIRKDCAKRKFLKPMAETLYNPMRFLYLKYESGHPAKNCVWSQIEGIAGDAVYLDPDHGFLPGPGFYPAEYEQGAFRIQWMNEKEAQFYISGRQKGSVRFKIRYRCICEGMTVCIRADGQMIYEARADIENTAELEFLNPKDKEVLVLTVRTDRLDAIDEYLHNGDQRWVGIGIECVDSVKDKDRNDREEEYHGGQH